MSDGFKAPALPARRKKRKPGAAPDNDGFAVPAAVHTPPQVPAAAPQAAEKGEAFFFVCFRR